MRGRRAAAILGVVLLLRWFAMRYLLDHPWPCTCTFGGRLLRATLASLAFTFSFLPPHHHFLHGSMHHRLPLLSLDPSPTSVAPLMEINCLSYTWLAFFLFWMCMEFLVEMCIWSCCTCTALRIKPSGRQQHVRAGGFRISKGKSPQSLCLAL